MTKPDSMVSSVSQEVERCLERLQQMISGNIPPTIKSGVQPLDDYMGGFTQGSIYPIISTAEVEKADFALSLFYRLSCQASIPAVYYSLNQTAQELILKLVAMAANLHPNKIRTGLLSPKDHAAVFDSPAMLSNSQGFLIDCPLSQDTLFNDLHGLIEARQLKFVFIDNVEGVLGQTYGETEVMLLARKLKVLAERTGCIIIPLFTKGESIPSFGGAIDFSFGVHGPLVDLSTLAMIIQPFNGDRDENPQSEQEILCLNQDICQSIQIVRHVSGLY